MGLLSLGEGTELLLGFEPHKGGSVLSSKDTQQPQSLLVVLSGAPRLQVCFLQVLFCNIKLSSMLFGAVPFIPTHLAAPSPVLSAAVTCRRQR